MGKTIAQTYYEEGIEAGELRGELKGLQKAVLNLGKSRFGAPDESVQRAIENLEQPEGLTERVLVASSWADLLKTP